MSRPLLIVQQQIEAAAQEFLLDDQHGLVRQLAPPPMRISA
jgi:hypothetical protein